MTGAELRVGDRVELVVSRRVHPGSIIPLRPGDRGVVRAVGHARYAVDFDGVLVVVRRHEVILQGQAYIPGARR